MASGWLGRLKLGLEKSSQKITGDFKGLFVAKKIDKAILTELEELLIQADLGVPVSSRLTAQLSKTKLDQKASPQEVKEILAAEIIKILMPIANPLKISAERTPHVILICGVNGSGKTTTIGKLARQFVRKGQSTTLVAGDTFRAAAVEQLEIWGERSGSKVVSRSHGSDAAGLVFDALKNSKNDKDDILIIDTAGRLQNRSDLMAELEKIVRVIKKIDDTAPHDVLLVMDATIGQNAHRQVEAFKQSINVSGLIITKLDGSAKGGVVISLAENFGLDVHAVGVGEGIDDLQQFEPEEFARSLLDIE